MQITIFLFLLFVLIPIGRFGGEIVHTELFFFTIIGLIAVGIWEYIRS